MIMLRVSVVAECCTAFVDMTLERLEPTLDIGGRPERAPGWARCCARTESGRATGE